MKGGKMNITKKEYDKEYYLKKQRTQTSTSARMEIKK